MALKSLNFTLLVKNIDSEELSVFAEQLNKNRMTAPEFFNEAPIVVQVKDSSLNIDFFKLKQIIKEQSFILLGITGDLSATQKEQIKAQKIALLRSSTRQPRVAEVALEPENLQPEIATSVMVKTKIHSGRVRSGQQIYAKEGDLVINGDVSAGAEVIADGNIHIYGALRGKALAGAMGEKHAAIFCQLLSPELVSIAGIYKLSDDLPADSVGKSSFVSLENEQIVLANLSRV